jgi:serine/threonine-protein kinase
MLVGRPPFVADSAEALIRMQARDPVPSITTVRPDLGVPEDLVATVARACAKDPADRQPSAAALAVDLARSLGREIPLPTPMPRPSFQAPRPGRTVAPPVPPAVPRRRPDPGQRLRLVVVLIAAIALGVAGTALFLHGRTVTTSAPR